MRLKINELMRITDKITQDAIADPEDIPPFTPPVSGGPAADRDPEPASAAQASEGPATAARTPEQTAPAAEQEAPHGNP